MDDSKKTTAQTRFADGAGSSDSVKLVDALLSASQEQLLDTIAGSGLQPTTMPTMRAQLLYYASIKMGRVLQQREVEVLFRIVPADARRVLATMRATYEDALRQQFLVQMRRAARVKPGGTDAEGLTWIVTLTDSANFQTAWDEVIRLGYKDEARPNPASGTIEIPRQVAGDDVLDRLGLAKPQSATGGGRSTRR